MTWEEFLKEREVPIAWQILFDYLQENKMDPPEIYYIICRKPFIPPLHSKFGITNPDLIYFRGPQVIEDPNPWTKKPNPWTKKLFEARRFSNKSVSNLNWAENQNKIYSTNYQPDPPTKILLSEVYFQEIFSFPQPRR